MTYLALTGVGAYLTVTSFGFGITTESSWVSAGTMPFGVGVLLLLISALLFLKSLRAATVKRRSETQARVASEERAQQDGNAREDVDGKNEVPPAKRLRHVVLVAGAVLAAILLTPYLGLMLAFGLMVLFLSAYVERKPLLPSLGITVAAIVVFYLVFRLFLGVPLPPGPFGGVI